MTAAPTAVIDALNSLLEAEQNSVMRFMGEGSPYLSQATAELRKPLNDMVLAGQRRTLELADMIERLGGVPMTGSIQPEEQFLAFLTIKFLLPKLVQAETGMVQRYQNTVSALKDAPESVIDLIKSHLQEHRDQLATLERAATAQK
jgi:hypothetical protein